MKKIHKLFLFALVLITPHQIKAQPEIVDSLLQELNRPVKDTNKVKAYQQLAWQLKSSNPDTAIYYALKGIDLAKELDYKGGIAGIFNDMGVINYYQGNYDKAIEFYNKALEINKERENLSAQAYGYNNLGIVFSRKGDYAKTIEFYQKALKIYEDLNNEKWMADLYNNIGIIHYYQKNYDKAIDYYKKTIDIRKRLNQKKKLANCYQNLGGVYYQKENLEKAHQYYENALTTYKVLNDPRGLAGAYSNLGIILREREDYESAIQYYTKALEINKSLEDKSGIARTLGNMAALFKISADSLSAVDKHSLSLAQINTKKEKYYSKAMDYATQAVSIAKELDAFNTLSHQYEILMEVNRKLNNPGQALEYADLYIATRDSLFNKEKTKAIEEMEARYQAEKKQQQIDLQQAEIAEKEAEIKRRNLLNYSLAGGVLFLALLGATIFRNYKQKRKANILLTEKNEQITHQNAKIENQNRELERHRHELEKIVEERTEDLKKAKEKAEESDRLKSAFLATMSHELRTPLNHIIGFSDLMDQETDTDEMVSYAATIHESGMNLLTIIEDILSFSMFETSEIKIRKQSLLLSQLFMNNKSSLDQLLSDAGKAHLKTVYKPHTELMKVRINSDEFKINQVLLNLFKNAIKFTHEGFIEFGFYHRNYESLVFYVKDSGIGIPKDKHDVIFDYFRQLDDSHTREYEGIGLGLAISKKVANAMGGKLELESEPGMGSTFYFVLPGMLQGSQETTHYQAKETITDKNSLVGRIMLVVEDDQESRYLMERKLKRTGVTIYLASNGKEAIEIYQKYPDIQLILMDLKMPEMDGYEATQKIKEINHNIPIIALSAYVMKSDRDKAFRAGCDDFMPKPFNNKQLDMILKKYL
ncbi:MAG: tetratricopeptide repeat protein [Bacteroidales bacterium]|nr:tetratricopeptide repeat protein [Bacteroidales bacterium]